MTPVSLDLAVDLTRRAIILLVELSLPLLICGMVVGLLSSLLQAVTQVQDQALSFVPRLLAGAAVLFLTLPWALSALSEHARASLLGIRTLLYP